MCKADEDRDPDLQGTSLGIYFSRNKCKHTCPSIGDQGILSQMTDLWQEVRQEVGQVSILATAEDYWLSS